MTRNDFELLADGIAEAIIKTETSTRSEAEKLMIREGITRTKRELENVCAGQNARFDSAIFTRHIMRRVGDTLAKTD